MPLDEGRITFRCSDLDQQCPWQISGNDEEQILEKIKQHGREKHNATSINEQDEEKIRRAIRRQAA
jgi:predicted small metal-binding protein